MECIETTLNRIVKYNDILEKSTKKLLPDNMETEELLKTFSHYIKLFDIIGKLFFRTQISLISQIFLVSFEKAKRFPFYIFFERGEYSNLFLVLRSILYKRGAGGNFSFLLSFSLF